MSYQVIARKWRPRQFDQMVGQEHVVRALTNALDTDRVHHAYLFTGTRGVGKTTIARIFAKSLNCLQGPTSTPCGECDVCQAVDGGRFVDLLEIDAASNTGVDDVRELIENAQYAPVQGRFKVYLVDEVHMLSNSAFNALLKTLEEPPPHVKFLLATTDPQKLPATVLSRCLKFDLKRLLPDQISGQIEYILNAENLPFEVGAVAELARAADGSLRDGLSLLDQAVAYGGEGLKTDDVRSMLGMVGREHLFLLLQELAKGDGQAMLKHCEDMAAFSPDFTGVLDELARLLHRVQLEQLVDGFHDEGPDGENLAKLAEQIAAEDVQLYYQLALTGKKELLLAPDVRVGFEMTLLRMLAFRPENVVKPKATKVQPSSPSAPPSRPAINKQQNKQENKQQNKQPPVTAPVTATEQAPASPLPAKNDASFEPTPENWEQWIEKAGLQGFLYQLAIHSTVQSYADKRLTLAVPATLASMAVEPLTSQLQEKLATAAGYPVKLAFVTTKEKVDTPASRHQLASEKQQVNAEQAIEEDPLIATMKQEMGARVVPGSIQPHSPSE